MDKLTQFERDFTLRLIALADDATSRGVPVDLAVRSLLGAGLVIAQRHASAASIAAQLQPVLDALAEQDDEPQRPTVQ